MTRDEIEAVIRAQLTRITTNSLTTGTASKGILNRATEAILHAVDGYARAMNFATLAEIRSYRHQPVTHLQRPTSPPGTPVCQRQAPGTTVTEDVAAVTCGNCAQSRAYSQATRTPRETP